MKSFSSFSSRKYDKKESETELVLYVQWQREQERARERERWLPIQTQIAWHLMHIHPIFKVKENSPKSIRWFSTFDIVERRRIFVEKLTFQ